MPDRRDATPAARTDVPAYAQWGGHVPPGSSWGVFRDDPERGTANFAGAAQVLDAVAGVRTGQVFNLDHALDAFDPPMARARKAPQHELLLSHAESRDDVLREFYLQATSQVDGLRHRRASGYGFYNGVTDDEIQAGAPALGVQRWAEKPIVGRGLVVDIEGLLAAEGAPLDHRTGPALDVDLLDRAIRAQGGNARPRRSPVCPGSSPSRCSA